MDADEPSVAATAHSRSHPGERRYLGLEWRKRAQEDWCWDDRDAGWSPGQITAPIDDDVERLHGRLVINIDQESLSVWRDTVV